MHIDVAAAFIQFLYFLGVKFTDFVFIESKLSYVYFLNKYYNYSSKVFSTFF